MSEPQGSRSSQAQPLYEEDNIDLGRLFHIVWSKRRMIVLILAVFTVLFWLVAGVAGLRAPRFERFSKNIKLIFSGVEQSEYPNGTGFSPSHLITPVILNEVYESNALADLNISVGAFVDAFAAAAYTPESEFIVKRYRSLLDARGLSVAEIEGLGAQFAQELQQAARSGVQLTFTVRGGALPGEMARKVLDDVPLAWQRYMIEQRGIFRTESPFISPRAVDRDLLAAADYVVVYDMLTGKLRAALQNIVTLRQMPNSENVADPETGLALEDLETILEDLRDFSLEAAVVPALAYGASRSPEATTRYFLKRVADLSRDKALLEENARLVADTFDIYASSNLAQRARIEATPGSAGGLTTIPQFGSDFLDRLVELGTRSGDMAFRQGLARERLDFALQAASIDAEISRLIDLVDRIRSSNGQIRLEDTSRAIQRSEEGFQYVQRRLIELLDVSLRIRTELERFNYGTDKALYRDLGTPIQKETTTVVFTTANVRWYGILTLLLLMILPCAILLQSFLNPDKNDNAGEATPGA